MVPVIRRPPFIYKNPSGPLYGAWAELELTDTVATGFGGLRMPIGSPNLDLYSILGARYFNDGLSITPKVPGFGFQHSASANKDWVDPIVGLTGRYRIDDKWFVNAEGHIGGPQQQRCRPGGRPASRPANGAGCSLPFRSALLIGCLRAGVWSHAQVFIATAIDQASWFRAGVG
jgi:hypothetical protein